MPFEYKLPKSDGSASIYQSNTNSVIIVGANGSGKSRLGAWIELQDPQNIHRVSGQRILNFDMYVPLKSESQASKELWFGRDNAHEKEGGRWKYNSYAGKYDYTTQVLNDVNSVMSFVFARKAVQDSDFKELYKNTQLGNKDDLQTKDIIDDLVYIWNNVFPHRKIILKDNQIMAQLPSSTKQYKGT
ncbi:MAG: ABC transporter ATP-binding protein, partial [Alphaproteobacteria bacterium]